MPVLYRYGLRFTVGLHEISANFGLYMRTRRRKESFAFCRTAQERIVPDAEVSFQDGTFHLQSEEFGISKKEAMTLQRLLDKIAVCAGQKLPETLIHESQCCILYDAMAMLFHENVWDGRGKQNLWRFVYEELDAQTHSPLAQ